MRRRTLIGLLGLGAAGSTTVALTGASLTDNTDSGADNRVLSERNLRLRQGADVDTSLDQYSEDELSTRDIEPADCPIAYVDQDDEDDDHTTQALIATEETYTDTESFTAINELENQGTQVSVGIEFEYGQAVGGDGLAAEDVADLFRFYIDGTRISPDSSNPDEPATVYSINAGTIRQVDLEIYVDSDAVATLEEMAGIGQNAVFHGNDRNDMQLLESFFYVAG